MNELPKGSPSTLPRTLTSPRVPKNSAESGIDDVGPPALGGTLLQRGGEPLVQVTHARNRRCLAHLTRRRHREEAEEARGGLACRPRSRDVAGAQGQIDEGAVRRSGRRGCRGRSCDRAVGRLGGAAQELDLPAGDDGRGRRRRPRGAARRSRSPVAGRLRVEERAQGEDDRVGADRGQCRAGGASARPRLPSRVTIGSSSRPHSVSS